MAKRKRNSALSAVIPLESLISCKHGISLYAWLGNNSNHEDFSGESIMVTHFFAVLMFVMGAQAAAPSIRSPVGQRGQGGN